MKSGWKDCQYCGKKLYEGRHDRAFCNDKCAAAWHRARTPEGEHARKQPGEVHSEKDRTTGKHCEHCANWFWYNDYAERGGERIPQYCSNKCRQAAYRARKKGTAKAGQQQNQSGKRDDKQRQQDRQRDFWGGTQKPDWWTILGVKQTDAWATITGRWKELVQKYHPDRNRDQEAWANERLTDINEAYQALKKYYGKNVKQSRV